MKHFKSISLGILSLLILSTSCSKDDDPSPQGTNPQGSEYYLTAIVDGVEFSTSNAKVSALADQSEFYNIVGLHENSNKISFSLIGPPATGISVPEVGAVTRLSYLQAPLTVWAAIEDIGSGSITITENTEAYMTGTFSFIGANPANTSETISVTEGSFKAQKL